MSPETDQMAIDSYFRVVRCLKDAYPASYNDIGKLWDTISGIAKQALPYINAVAPQVGNVAGRVLRLGDSIRATNKQRKKSVNRQMLTLSVPKGARQQLSNANSYYFSKGTIPRADKNKSSAMSQRAAEVATMVDVPTTTTSTGNVKFRRFMR
jgi:hypothetical protein